MSAPDVALTPTRAAMPLDRPWGSIMAEVAVSDVPRSLRFWIRGLGFALEHRRLDAPDYAVLSHPDAAPNCYVVLCGPQPSSETEPLRPSVVQLEHPHPADVAQRCLDAGFAPFIVRHIEHSVDAQRGHWEAITHDPDGNTIRVVGRPERYAASAHARSTPTA